MSFAGCSDEQTQFDWDLKVILTAPQEVIAQRLITRATNRYGRSERDRAQVLADRPLLRRGADVVIDTTQPLARVADTVLAASGADALFAPIPIEVA